MGVRGSSLRGKASVPEALLQFTSWGVKELHTLRVRHQHDLGGAFALTRDKFAMLIGISIDEADPLFYDIFDTDKNNLVDAFEMMICFAMLSQMTLQEKVDY